LLNGRAGGEQHQDGESTRLNHFSVIRIGKPMRIGSGD